MNSLLLTFMLLQPCDSFLYFQKLSDSFLYYSEKKVYRKFKVSASGAWNEETKNDIFSSFDEGNDINEIVEEIGIENIFKINVRFRYKYPEGNKIYIGNIIKGSSHTIYIGIKWNPGSKASWRIR